MYDYEFNLLKLKITVQHLDCSWNWKMPGLALNNNHSLTQINDNLYLLTILDLLYLSTI